eukprot:Gb_24198 [translate_table: standard]
MTVAKGVQWQLGRRIADVERLWRPPLSHRGACAGLHRMREDGGDHGRPQGSVGPREETERLEKEGNREGRNRGNHESTKSMMERPGQPTLEEKTVGGAGQRGETKRET